MSSRIDDHTLLLYDRSYHEYSTRELANILPVDQAEEERLNEWHDILKIFFRERLVFPSDISPKRVLDCGYGTGIWADDMCDQYGCEIYGIDVFNGTYNDSPDNSDKSSNSGSSASRSSSGDETVFSVKTKWDLNRPLLQNRDIFTESGLLRYNAKVSFDLVNIRCLTEGIRSDRWPPLMRELWTLIKPGGWVQMIELDFANIGLSLKESDDNIDKELNAIEEWEELYKQGMRQMQRNINIAQEIPTIMTNMGFENVIKKDHQLDIGSWRQDENANLNNRISRVVQASIGPLGLFMSCKILNNTPQQYHDLVQRAILELQDQILKPYINCHIIIGRRPLSK